MSTLETLAKEWSTRLEQYRMTHYLLADRLRWWNNVVGSAAVLASAVVSAGILTTVHDGKPGFWWKIAGAIVGLIATSLTGLRTYLQFGEVSERHRVAAAKFGGIKRELDVLIDSHPNWSDQKIEQLVTQKGDAISQLEQTAPGYSRSWWDKGCAAARGL